MRAIFAAMGRSYEGHRRRCMFRREFCDTLFSRTYGAVPRFTQLRHTITTKVSSVSGSTKPSMASR